MKASITDGHLVFVSSTGLTFGCSVLRFRDLAGSCEGVLECIDAAPYAMFTAFQFMGCDDIMLRQRCVLKCVTFLRDFNADAGRMPNFPKHDCFDDWAADAADWALNSNPKT